MTISYKYKFKVWPKGHRQTDAHIVEACTARDAATAWASHYDRRELFADTECIDVLVLASGEGAEARPYTVEREVDYHYLAMEVTNVASPTSPPSKPVGPALSVEPSLPGTTPEGRAISWSTNTRSRQ